MCHVGPTFSSVGLLGFPTCLVIPCFQGISLAANTAIISLQEHLKVAIARGSGIGNVQEPAQAGLNTGIPVLEEPQTQHPKTSAGLAIFD